MAIQEDVNSFANGVWERDNTVYSRLPIKYAYVVGQVVEDRQIMLYYNDVGFDTKEGADHTTCRQTLLDLHGFSVSTLHDILQRTELALAEHPRQVALASKVEKSSCTYIEIRTGLVEHIPISRLATYSLAMLLMKRHGNSYYLHICFLNTDGANCEALHVRLELAKSSNKEMVRPLARSQHVVG
jgi:hypothetical protein